MHNEEYMKARLTTDSTTTHNTAMAPLSTQPAALSKAPDVSNAEKKDKYKHEEGFNLYYSGRKFGSDNKSDEVGFARFRNNFREMGALAIRYHVGHSQRVALFEQIAREDYNQNPTDGLGKGMNQDDLFKVSSNASSTRRNTRMLDKLIHHSLGRGKILNERTQRIKDRNPDIISGEQHLWEMMHSSVWSSGLNLGGQLTNQGFCYLTYPVDMTQKEYDAVSKELVEGKFSVIQNEKTTSVTTNSGRVLSSSPIAQLKTHLDPDHKMTKQDNGFVMEAAGIKAPLGWIFHPARNKVVPTSCAENLIRIMRIAQGGSHRMTPGEFRIVFANLLKNENGLSTFTQNQSFNAMLSIYRYLEEEFNFDPSQLITEDALRRLSYDRIQAETKATHLTDDFLTGLLLTEMAQPLKTTLPNSTRGKLALRFTYPFNIIQNNAKAIAYSLDLKAKNGEAVLKLEDEKAPVSIDSDLVDCKINGSLSDPTLNNPKHIASILSAAMLVTEQVMMEQLLRDACLHGDNHPNAKALKNLLKNNARGNSEALYAELISMARMVPQNRMLGPVLGLQFSYCESIVETIRESLGFSHQKSLMERIFGASHRGLVEIIEELSATDEATLPAKLAALRNDADLERVLLNLFNIAKTMQNLPGISVRGQQSRGVNAGLIPVIKKLTPSLYSRLERSGEIAMALSLDAMPSSHYGIRRDLGMTEEKLYGEQGAFCPFLNSRNSQSKSHAPALSFAHSAAVVSGEAKKNQPADPSVSSHTSRMSV